MRRPILFLAFILSLPLVLLAGCGGDDGGSPGTTGGETASAPVEPETPRDESGSTSSGGAPGSENPCNLVDCATGLHCVLVEVQCIRAPCPPQPTCVADASSCAATLCAPNTRCVESAGGARCVPTP